MRETCETHPSSMLGGARVVPLRVPSRNVAMSRAAPASVVSVKDDRLPPKAETLSKSSCSRRWNFRAVSRLWNWRASFSNPRLTSSLISCCPLPVRCLFLVSLLLPVCGTNEAVADEFRTVTDRSSIALESLNLSLKLRISPLRIVQLMTRIGLLLPMPLETKDLSCSLIASRMVRQRSKHSVTVSWRGLHSGYKGYLVARPWVDSMSEVKFCSSSRKSSMSSGASRISDIIAMTSRVDLAVNASTPVILAATDSGSAMIAMRITMGLFGHLCLDYDTCRRE